MRHSITCPDEATSTGTCSVCGPTPVYKNSPYNGRVYWRCASKQRSYANGRYGEVKDRQRDARFLRVYGITVEQYDALLEKQGGVCTRCKQPPGQLRLAVDHNHETGEVRGLLCGPCNTFIGRLEANMHMLDNDLAYIRSAIPIAERLTQ